MYYNKFLVFKSKADTSTVSDGDIPQSCKFIIFHYLRVSKMFYILQKSNTFPYDFAMKSEITVTYTKKFTHLINSDRDIL